VISNFLPALTGAHGDPPGAVRVDGAALSFAQLSTAAGAVAERIAGAGTVAVVATPTIETLVAIVGGLVAGVPVVPVPPDSGPVERAHIRADSGATLLLAAAGAPALEGLELPTVPVRVGDRSRVVLAEPASDAAPALILYTSGTTGPPKGVPLRRAAIAADLDALAEVWAWTADDVLVHGLPIYHVHGLVLGVLGALRTGSRLVHTGRPRPDLLAAAEGSLYFGVPTVWGRVCADRAAARALTGARLLVSGSAPLPAAVFADLSRLTGQRPVERYGMTETLITVSARVDGARQPGAVGTPVRGAETRLGDDGELQVRGPMVFGGYHGRPSVDAFTADGWFRTGDVATIDADGVHRIVGRASTDLIKTGGFRVGAGEVEEALTTHPAVREAAVVGAPHDDLGQAIVAYVVAEDVTADALVAFVAERLSAHKRPRTVVFVDALPRNALGKVQKHLLR